MTGGRDVLRLIAPHVVSANPMTARVPPSGPIVWESSPREIELVKVPHELRCLEVADAVNPGLGKKQFWNSKPLEGFTVMLLEKWRAFDRP